MRHMGLFNENVDALKPGGLTQAEIDDLKARGWGEETTRYDVHDAYLAFADSTLPGGVTLRRVSVPAGTRYLFNPEEGIAVVVGCGNPTCWRHLM